MPDSPGVSQTPGAVRAVRAPAATELDAAWDVVRAHLPPTPLVATTVDVPALGPIPVLLKLETTQPTGSFKVRGALSALSRLPAGERAVTASAGNHGLGTAWAAGVTAAAATVVVSRSASPAKVAALQRFPVELVEHGTSYDEAETHALGLAGGPGRRFVSAYNDPDVIAGQASIGFELDEQLEAVDDGERPQPLALVTPVGGGGLAAGLALWGRERARRPVRLVGVEAAASSPVAAAVAAGSIVPVEVEDTLADGLAGNLEPGSVTPGLIGTATTLARVGEDEIVAAMRWLFSHHGLVVEGSAAVGLAALLAGAIPAAALEGVLDGTPLVVLLTGRNITTERYAQVLGAR
jgi:threonine dehydratase